ncbi:type IV conjugative transfer system protein TraL [Aeromonas caviae]|uniref:type IV conjugative transfer system protein TraL n=1 Tax=Aeromonas caviae TaxID=648 RepID=UPI0029DA98EE|nr:type IV conjugative transfer system protein TraL [Aeromonas caviae]MDX7800276.1 type IV conjugative transfer system protein TraL [Aeromonas caviae]
MSSDYEMYLVPERLDDPFKILIFTTQELGLLLAPILVGWNAGQFILGIAVGFMFYLVFRKAQKGDPDFLSHVKYWIFPKFVSGLRYLPDSAIRLYYS